MDKSVLARWRQLDAVGVLAALCEHAKEDPSFRPRASLGTSRWHVRVNGAEFEILCTGPRYFDTRAQLGGGGAVDLAMHLLELDFKQAVAVLSERGL